MTRILVAAGEASGDLHAARLVAALRRDVPDLEVVGLGGGELEAVGMRRLADSADISVVGITEVLKILGRAREIFQLLLDEVDREPPDLAILVDFPDFNLRLAKQLSRRGVRVLYYISPQVWAWRRGRVKLISRCVDKMLVLFPFEAAWYRDHGVEAVHVGHPLVDEVPHLESVWDRTMSTSAPTAAADPFRVVLLPGSRRSEIGSLLPTMARAVERLGRDVPVRAQVLCAPSIDPDLLRQTLDREGLADSIDIVTADRFRAIADAHLALCASGTATLEVGLLGTPMIVVYRLKATSYWLARAMVRLPFFSLVNLVLETAAVPELLQGEANPERIAHEARSLLEDPEVRDRQREELARVRSALGASGATERAAKEVLACLPTPV